MSLVSKISPRWVYSTSSPLFRCDIRIIRSNGYTARFWSSKNYQGGDANNKTLSKTTFPRNKNLPPFIPHSKNRRSAPTPPTPISASASTNPNAPESALFGRDVAEALTFLRANPNVSLSKPQYAAETVLRGADYLSAPWGSNEDLVYRRRALMELGAVNTQERKKWEQELDALIREEEEEEYGQLENYRADVPSLKEEDMTHDIWSKDDASAADTTKKLNSSSQHSEPWTVQDLGKDDGEESGEGRKELTQNQKAYGPWSDMTIRVDRIVKVQRGGKMVRYRALVIGGNLNGCAGFGVAKAAAPNEAAAAAARLCKRNIFFMDRTMGSGLTFDLAGRHNSCRVLLRSVRPQRGLKGHPLIQEILKFFGVTDCTAKSHGNRNIYNIVQATFKAIMTHESMEDVALKRGKRLLNLERAKRLHI